MKTIDEIKNEVAKDSSHLNWSSLSFWYDSINDLEPYMNKVIKRYTEEVIKECADRLNPNHPIYRGRFTDEPSKQKKAIIHLIEEIK